MFIGKKLKKNNIKKVHIKFVSNNIFFSLTDSKGNLLKHFNLGLCKMDKRTLKAYAPFQKFLIIFCRSLRSLRINKILLFIKGWSFFFRSIVKQLHKAKIRIHQIKVLTNLPHNGCRRSKIRRL